MAAFSCHGLYMNLASNRERGETLFDLVRRSLSNTSSTRPNGDALSAASSAQAAVDYFLPRSFSASSAHNPIVSPGSCPPTSPNSSTGGALQSAHSLPASPSACLTPPRHTALQKLAGTNSPKGHRPSPLSRVAAGVVDLPPTSLPGDQGPGSPIRPLHTASGTNELPGQYSPNSHVHGSPSDASKGARAANQMNDRRFSRHGSLNGHNSIGGAVNGQPDAACFSPLNPANGPGACSTAQWGCQPALHMQMAAPMAYNGAHMQAAQHAFPLPGPQMPNFAPPNMAGAMDMQMLHAMAAQMQGVAASPYGGFNGANAMPQAAMPMQQSPEYLAYLQLVQQMQMVPGFAQTMAALAAMQQPLGVAPTPTPTTPPRGGNMNRRGGDPSSPSNHKRVSSGGHSNASNEGLLHMLKEVGGKRVNTSAVLGHMVQFSLDQHGSRFIQVSRLYTCRAGVPDALTYALT